MAGSGKQARLLTLSGLAVPTEDSPYLIWLRRSWPWMEKQLGSKAGWIPSPANASIKAPEMSETPASGNSAQVQPAAVEPAKSADLQKPQEPPPP